jgi:hypothetical protein
MATKLDKTELNVHWVLVDGARVFQLSDWQNVEEEAIQLLGLASRYELAEMVSQYEATDFFAEDGFNGPDSFGVMPIMVDNKKGQLCHG